MGFLPALEPALLPADAVEVGRVIDAWGVKGWIKVAPHSADPEALFSSRRWFLMAPDRGPRCFEGSVKVAVREAKTHGTAVVASLRDLDDRAGAEQLRGSTIWVGRSSFPSLPDDEFYWVDLIGTRVVNEQGIALGEVVDLLPSGPQTVLVLQDRSGAEPVERLIPFVSAFIQHVDLAQRLIRVDWQPDY